MRLGHGENAAATDPGLSKTLGPAPRAQAGQAERHHQAPKDAHLQVGAGQEAGVVGHVDRDGYIRGPIRTRRASDGSYIHTRCLLVPVPTQGEGNSRPRPRFRRIWDHVSGRISALRSLFASPFGPRRAPVPPQDAQTHGNLDVSAGSGVQHGLQTTRSRTGGPDSNVHQAPAELDRRAFIVGTAAALGVMAAGGANRKANVPVKIDRPFIYPGSRDGNSINFFHKKGIRYVEVAWVLRDGTIVPMDGIDRGRS